MRRLQEVEASSKGIDGVWIAVEVPADEKYGCRVELLDVSAEVLKVFVRGVDCKCVGVGRDDRYLHNIRDVNEHGDLLRGPELGEDRVDVLEVAFDQDHDAVVPVLGWRRDEGGVVVDHGRSVVLVPGLL